jgi:DNA-binding CsgD family transcriptional regulator
LFVEADRALAEARAVNAELLAPETFTRGLEAYAAAESDLARGRNMDRIRSSLATAARAFADAGDAAEIANVTLASVLKTRADATNATAATFAAELWAEAEESFTAAARRLESGDIRGARGRAEEAETLYRDAELTAIKAQYLSQTRALLAEAEARPVDPLHRWFLDRAAAESRLALGEWAEAAGLTERALSGAATALWEARFVMYGTVAEVELALDARARREPLDPDATAARLRERIDAARDAAKAGQGTEEAPDSAAHLAHAAATVTRLHDSDPEAWAEAARRWVHLGDPFWLSTARLREAEAAAARGETARAAEALREAHRLGASLPSEPLLTEIEAVSRRTRLSVEAPVARVLESSAIDQLGLTAREAEVLSLVAAGQTNRQIGEALFVSEKTASVHVSNILRKLGVNSRVDAAAVAQRLGVA